MQTVVVAHGALGSAEQMRPVAETLQTLGDDRVRLEVIEFPGHGRTPLGQAEAFRLPRFVDELAVMMTHHTAPPLLFGYSMGGYVGVALEARAPGTFAGILTLGTKFDWDVPTAEREAARLDPGVVATKIPRFAATLAARHEGAGGWETVMVRTAALLRANAEAPLLSLDVLERIGIPVTIAVGAKDETVTAAESQAAAAVMRHGRCVVLDDVPHPIERVPPDLLLSLMRSMLAVGAG